MQTRLFSLYSILLFLCVTMAGADSWIQKSNMLHGRWGFGAVDVDGLIYVVGGANVWSFKAIYPPMEIYDPAANSWIEKTQPPTPRTGACVCALNGNIFLIGGYNWGVNEGYTLPKVEVYSTRTNTWSTKKDMPFSLDHCTCCTLNGKIYVIGGMHVVTTSDLNNLDAAIYGTVEEYTPETDTWATKTPMPTKRWGHAACCANGKIYVIGGATKYASSPIGTVEEYNPSTDSWSTKANMPTDRFHISAGVINGKIYVTGGFKPDSVSPVYYLYTEEYNPITNSWSKKSDIPKEKIKHATCVLNGKMYVFGGFKALTDTTGSTDVFMYEPSAPTFVESVPAAFSLSQNHPNPFNPLTTIPYSIAQPGMVHLAVYDILGRKVATLVQGQMNPGYYAATWNADGFASGIYYCRLEQDGKVETNKMLLMK